MGCRIIVIDNLSSLASKFDKDERRGIDLAMLELAELAQTLNTTIFLVCHVSKPAKDRTPFELGGMVYVTDARGSYGIAQHCTYAIALERDKTAEGQMKNLTTVRVLEDRETGDSDGKTFRLLYNHDGILEEYHGK